MRSAPLALTFASLLVAACVSPGTTPMGTETETSAATETSGTTTTTSTTVTTTTTSTTTSVTTTTTLTTQSMGVCGDGTVDDGEECDDGEGNGDNAACTSACALAICGDGKILTGTEECDDGTDNADDAACTSECMQATCGDAKIQAGVEDCDNGVNDGSYGTCNGDCSLAPGCGDGVVQDGFEDCDGVDINTGCLGDCTFAASCLQIISQWPDAQSGVYSINPPVADISTMDVFCEMKADGGGYTMVKVDTLPELTGGEAETFCQKYGMRLAVPRTKAHLHALYDFATKQNLAPIGMKDLPASDEYMTILGIYPKVAGQSCVSQPFNSDQCPEWRANDDGLFWVADVAVPTEPSKKNCDLCSMVYTWKNDGSLDAFQALSFNGGYASEWFMCTTSDK
jgi:hypothetical protein